MLLADGHLFLCQKLPLVEIISLFEISVAPIPGLFVSFGGFVWWYFLIENNDISTLLSLLYDICSYTATSQQ